MQESHEHKHPAHDFDGIVENREQRPPAYFIILFYGLVLWAAVFGAYYLLSGWSSQGEFRQKMDTFRQQQAQRQPPSPTPASAPAPAASEARGKELFGQFCAACHGAEGKGGIGPDLTAAGFKYGRTADAIRTSIAGGRPGGMPAFGTQVSAGEIDALVQFVLGLKP